MDVYDIQLDKDTLDVSVKNGDFVVAESTSQHKLLIMLAAKGEFKESPNLGAAIENYLLDEHPGGILDSIRRNLLIDGMRVRAINFVEGKLNVDANYE